MIIASLLFGASLSMNTLDFATRPPMEHELNPFMKPLMDTPITLAVVKASTAVILPELCARHLDKKGKKTHAKIVRVFAIIAPTFGVITNIRGKAKRNESIF